MREISLFLRLLAERVYDARLPETGQIRDAADFHAWLVEVSEVADHTQTPKEFLRANLNPKQVRAATRREPQ
jgi:hypothetical protein